MRTTSPDNAVFTSEASQEAAHGLEPPIGELLVSLWQNRRFVCTVSAGGAVVALVIVLLIPNRYTSTVQLMPPTQQSISESPLLAGLNPGSVSIGASLSMVHSSPAETVIGVLSSRTAEDAIITQFHLREVYHDKYLSDARKTLERNTTAFEDKRSGIVAIGVTDRDRYRARDIADAYIHQINSLLNTISSSSARNERIFLEGRLKSLKAELDETAKSLSTFSSQNATLNPQSQGQSTLLSTVTLQGQLITAESELAELKSQYANENVRVRAARARVRELEEQLFKMAGVGEDASASSSNGQIYPSLRKLPLLAYTYSDLSLRLTMEEGIYELLNRQYELAKVEEAKEIPSVAVLDAPNVPERKSSPHRMLIVLLGAIIAMLLSIGWVIGRRAWQMAPDSSSVKVTALSIALAFQRLRTTRDN